MKFALCFTNRGFFPGELVEKARQEIIEAVTASGNEYILMEASKTKYGAIEGNEEGKIYAEFLKQNEGAFDGVILCLPNFGDENAVVYALKNANVPILIQAYPDEIGKMDFKQRRDAYCGKFSVMDVFVQHGIPFTALKPHVCHPLSKDFAIQLDKFARICKVVKGAKSFSIGAIGARTTKFKTVRYDELTLQKHQVTVDCFDLSEVFNKITNYNNQELLDEQIKDLLDYSNFSKVPADKIDKIAKTILVIKDYVKEYSLDTIALRCWNEFPEILNISVCAVISYLNDIGIPTACEMDVCNALAMHLLSLASGTPSTCLDWNNNYGEEKDKCILFHCGPVPKSLMTDKGEVTDHKMFAKSNGEGTAYGSIEGRIAPCKFTYASALTTNGKLKLYLGKGEFTNDEIEKEYFGCGGVAKIENLEDILLYIGKNGYRHHVSVTQGDVLEVIEECCKTYLNYDLTVF